jgi:hypothetical protein
VAAVLYLMAAIGVAAVTTVLWKAVRPQRPTARSVLAPDDDPEFLRGLNLNRQQPGDDEG